MTTRTEEVTIAPPLVRFLRHGVKRQLAAKVDILQVQLDVHLTPETWNSALASFNEGCELLEEIGPAEIPEQGEIKLDVRRWPLLVVRALEIEYEDGVRRIRDAEADGFDPTQIGRNIPALGDLLQEVRQRTGIKPIRGRHISFLEAQLAKRRKGRRRGDGN